MFGQLARAGLGLSPSLKVGLRLLLKNEQARARMGLICGPSPAGPNFSNSGPTGSSFKRETDRQIDREKERERERKDM